MPRTARSIEAGLIYHVLNRGNGRMRLFHKDADFAAFERVLGEGLERYPVDLLAYRLSRKGRESFTQSANPSGYTFAGAVLFRFAPIITEHAPHAAAPRKFPADRHKQTQEVKVFF